ncbi:unnamed protein product [Heligmosomoides polygyrus]|uniref:MCM6_C domain-containing protein n=1 Tax=Heligmosomoides polygyrus TaxID=6339 RepID=A0A183GW47_HELPZ|nr:unnamed protein product [Heligmosomoides polygyrus]
MPAVQFASCRAQSIDRYLDIIEGDLEVKEDLLIQRTIYHRVIRRLVTEDHVLIEMDSDEKNPQLSAHSNYVVTDQYDMI